jgi:hypothetical protein
MEAHGRYLSNLCVLLGPFALKISYVKFFFIGLVADQPTSPRYPLDLDVGEKIPIMLHNVAL